VLPSSRGQLSEVVYAVPTVISDGVSPVGVRDGIDGGKEPYGRSLLRRRWSVDLPVPGGRWTPRPSRENHLPNMEPGESATRLSSGLSS